MAGTIGAGALRLGEEDQLVDEVLGDRSAPRPVAPSGRPLDQAQSERVGGVVGRLCLLFGITTAVVAAGALPGPDNAAVSSTEDRIELRFFGRWPAALDDKTLASVIAHELGHIAAHHPASAFGRARRIAADRGLPVDRRYAWATELTADRFALCGSTTAPEVLVGLAGHGGGQHPDRLVRLRAAELFARSDRYRQLTGRGPGALPIAEVDAAIARLLPDPERPIYTFGDVDVLDTPRWLERRWQLRRDGDRILDS